MGMKTNWKGAILLLLFAFAVIGEFVVIATTILQNFVVAGLESKENVIQLGWVHQVPCLLHVPNQF